MTAGDLTFADVDTLVDDLREIDVRADLDPADVKTPGVFVRPLGFSLDRLGGYTHRVQLHLVVPDNGYTRSRKALLDLFNKVRSLPLEPDEDPFYQGLVLPGRPDPLPGLVVPLYLSGTYTEE